MSVDASLRSASSSANDDVTERLACSVCGREFAGERRYFGHPRVRGGEVSWSCEKCPRSEVRYDSRSGLKNRENARRAPVRAHECSRCEDVFDRASQLDYHRRSVHLGEKSQICRICGKGFFRKNDLRTHLNVHLGTVQSICEICGKKFNHVSNLIRHCRTHAGAKPYPCSICGKRFTQTSSLARHRRIHERKISGSPDEVENVPETAVRDETRVRNRETGDAKRVSRRRHYCRICGESFRFMIDLRQHERLHTKKACDRIDKLRCQAGKDRQSTGTDISKDTQRTEISSNSSNDMIEPEPNSIRDHLLELDRKMNAIEIESEREVSISISDILSPYNCSDIELTSSDNLPPKLWEALSADSDKQSVLEKDYNILQCLRGVDFTTEIAPLLLEVEETNDKSTMKIDSPQKILSREIKTSTSINKHLRVEGSQFYIEICEPEYLKTSSLQTVELQEIENVALLREVFDVVDDEEDSKMSRVNAPEKSLEKSPSSDDDEADIRIDTIAAGEQTLRLVKTETGEQFYELIINSRTDFETVNARIEQVDDLPAVEEKSEDIEELSIERERNSNEFFQLLPSVENYRESIAAPSDGETEMPMVRLVQNEDGEQFFELIREPIEFERTRNETDNSNDERIVESSSNVVIATKPEVAVANSVCKRDKKESSTDNSPRPAKDRGRRFQCIECDKSFSTAYNFRQHTGTHFSDQQQFQCKECGLSFAWKSTLNKHLAINHRPDGPQKFVCEICPKVYGTLSQEHVKRDHLKERNHVCPYCGKSFFKKFDLKTHSRTHTNERPYVCRACGKRFHHQSHIIRHERIHSGERPYACDICQRSFAQPSSLKAHRQRHHDVKIDILDYRMDDDEPLSLAVQ